MPSDPPEVGQVLDAPWFTDGLREVAGRNDLAYPSALDEAAGHLREMAATHGEHAGELWSRFGRWILRAYDVVVDEEALRRLRALDRRHSLILLPAHRSYLDTWVAPGTLAANGISPQFALGGANLNFFPFGTVASRTGLVFIRRSTRELPVYRFALRSYIGQLIRNRANIGWSIEGGRTRTGKLRPPVYGVMRYVLDAVEAVDGPEVLIVPMSIVYDQLHEVATMTSEARGGRKRPEDIRWLWTFARSQRRRLGRAYVDIGEPIRVRERLTELCADEASRSTVVERISLDVCHRINRATPVTATAVVSLAMLGADRALTLDEVLATVAPLARYIAARGWPVAGAALLTDRATIRRTLQEMVASGVLTAYDGGTETVWIIGDDQHLVAAFYRNTVLHVLVNRAIGELALQGAAEVEGEARRTTWHEMMRIRELLKFEFFFPNRRDYSEEMEEELVLIEPDARAKAASFDASDVERWLASCRPLLAHLVLRPYLDAYLVVADRLAADDAGPDGERFDEERFLDECLRVGRQWALQRRLASEESVSLELFRNALRLARHRDLVESTEPDLPARRRAFAEELRLAVRRVAAIAELARTHAGVEA